MTKKRQQLAATAVKKALINELSSRKRGKELDLPQDAWRKEPCFLLHPLSLSIKHFPNHNKAANFILDYDDSRHWPWFIRSEADATKVRDNALAIYWKWISVLGLTRDCTPEQLFKAINAKASRPEWAWGAAAAATAPIGKSRQKCNATRAYHIDHSQCVLVSKESTTALQVRQLCNILRECNPVSLEASLMQTIKDSVSSGKLMTRQDPWRIFQYYRSELIKLNVIKLKSAE